MEHCYFFRQESIMVFGSEIYGILKLELGIKLHPHNFLLLFNWFVNSTSYMAK